MADVAIGWVQLAGGWTLTAHEMDGGVRVFGLYGPKGSEDERAYTYARGSGRATITHVEVALCERDSFGCDASEEADADGLRARAALYERVALDLDGRVCRDEAVVSDGC